MANASPIDVPSPRTNVGTKRRGLIAAQASENCSFLLTSTGTTGIDIPFSARYNRTRREFGEAFDW
jgi:hypothetical protein